MERYSREQLKDIKKNRFTNEAVKKIYDVVIDTCINYNQFESISFNIVYNMEIVNKYKFTDLSTFTDTSKFVIYIANANEAKNVVSKLKELFYDSKIEFIQKATIGEDKIYINWE